jgi:hypothetical protein
VISTLPSASLVAVWYCRWTFIAPVVAENVPEDGLYISALPRMTEEVEIPPATSTLPSLSRVAV